MVKFLKLPDLSYRSTTRKATEVLQLFPKMQPAGRAAGQGAQPAGQPASPPATGQSAGHTGEEPFGQPAEQPSGGETAEPTTAEQGFEPREAAHLEPPLAELAPERNVAPQPGGLLLPSSSQLLLPSSQPGVPQQSLREHTAAPLSPADLGSAAAPAGTPQDDPPAVAVPSSPAPPEDHGPGQPAQPGGDTDAGVQRQAQSEEPVPEL